MHTHTTQRKNPKTKNKHTTQRKNPKTKNNTLCGVTDVSCLLCLTRAWENYIT